MSNRVLRKTFGAASEGGTGDCKHCIMTCFTILVGYKKICRAYDRYGVEGNVCVILVWKLEGRLLFGIPGRSIEDNIKVSVKEMGW
jgi:hypothetical protein